MQAAQARMFAQPDLETRIKEYFYNRLVDYVLNQGEYNAENLDQKIRDGIMHIIRACIHASRQQLDSILPDSEGATVVRITHANCPDRYHPLHSALGRLKMQPEITAADLLPLCALISQLDTFRELNPAHALLSMAGLIEQQPVARHYNESNVTPDLIRKSFYNEMLMQALLAVDKGWISRQDLVEEEPKIYMSLPALTIIEAIQQSQHCANGIRLLDDKAVTLHSCPQEENFPMLVQAILAAKNKISAMSENQLMAVKHLLASERELPEELADLKTSELMATVGVINNMSIEISRSRVFHQMIGTVMENLLEMIPEQPTDKPMRLD